MDLFMAREARDGAGHALARGTAWREALVKTREALPGARRSSKLAKGNLGNRIEDEPEMATDGW